MNKILQGWKKILKDYQHWKLIIKYPYCDFDCAVFFGNLAEPPNSLEDWMKEMREMTEDEKVMFNNLWDLYDDIEEHIDETNKLL
jgi:hypothetical protein